MSKKCNHTTLILTPELVAAADAERARHLAAMRECQRRLRARRAVEDGRVAGRNGRPLSRELKQKPPGG
jgi:hypothetical protein